MYVQRVVAVSRLSFCGLLEHRRNINQLLSWLSGLSLDDDDGVIIPPRPFVPVPLVNQVAALVATPLTLVRSFSPRVQGMALRYLGKGKIKCGVLECEIRNETIARTTLIYIG